MKKITYINNIEPNCEEVLSVISFSKQDCSQCPAEGTL